MATDSHAVIDPNPIRRPLSAGRLLVRSAAVFGWSGAAGVAAFAIAFRDNPLKSEDPYLVGMLCGGLAAVAAAFYTMFETFVRRPIIVDFLYFELPAVWSVIVWIWTAVTPEAKGLGPYAAGGSLAACAIAWPLCRFRVPRRIAILAAAAGVLLVATYAIVALRIR
jgi:hypothetical protein